MTTTRPPGVPQASQHAVLRQYELRRRRIPVGNGTLSVVVPDERGWLRHGHGLPPKAAAAAGDRRSARDLQLLRRLPVASWEPPYWLRVWPAAVALARQLAATQLSQLSVLDLGCGIGVPGIQAAARGAAVCFVDRSPDSLEFAVWNASGQPGCAIRPTMQQLDWAQQRVAGRFDLALLSDVSYHRSHHEPVRQQLLHALDQSGCWLHADPMRERSTEFLRAQQSNYTLISWQRQIVWERFRGPVRLTLGCRSTSALQQWSARLGIAARSPHQVEEQPSE